MTPTDGPAHAAHRLLTDLGAGRLDHPGGTLLAHLGRVRDRLDQWGARPALRLAGLCHATYGTGGFAPVLLPPADRRRLRDVIGTEAEAIVFLYASCDRQATYASLTTTPTGESAAPDRRTAPTGRTIRFHDRFTGRTGIPGPRRSRDFAELTAANELDIACVDGAFRERWGADLMGLFTRLRPWLTDAAWQACERELGGV
ncbi:MULTISPECIES: DUF6817 domain-containing protein [Streptomyces]|uniref:DUF6817 domain-containing protein n=1 Tax=Streptomyces TaxID=1883 RepID=UPI0006EBB89F|nr:MULTISPECIES: hypothetical protein [Streptomyces]